MEKSKPTASKSKSPMAADQSNTIKDPDDWTTGDEPMTGAQASYLKTLCEETGAEFDASLSKAQASLLIDDLRAKDPRLQSGKHAGNRKAH